MQYLSVKELAVKLEKNPETIKRWIKNGKFPNAKKENDRNGWLIPLSDLELFQQFNGSVPLNVNNQINSDNALELDELVILAYEAVILSHPPDEVIELLARAGIKRTLQVLLTMQQSPTKVKHPAGFIKKALELGWNPQTIPVKIPRKKSKRLFELTQQDYNHNSEQNNTNIDTVPFYNWLEE